MQEASALRPTTAPIQNPEAKLELHEAFVSLAKVFPTTIQLERLQRIDGHYQSKTDHTGNGTYRRPSTSRLPMFQFEGRMQSLRK